MPNEAPQADAPASPSPQGRGTNGASAHKRRATTRKEVCYERTVADREAAKEALNSIDQRGELRYDHREVCKQIVGGMTDRDALAKKADVDVHVVDLVLGSALCEGYMDELRGVGQEVTPADLQAKLKPLAMKALEFYERILKDPDAYKTRDVVSVARDVLDRSVGASRITGSVVTGNVQHHVDAEYLDKVVKIGDEIRRNNKLMGAIETTAEPVGERDE